MPLNADLAGKDYGEITYEVTAEAIEKFARATNDLNERYLGSDVVAPPIFVVVPAFKSFMDASLDPELGADMLRLLHAAEEHVLYAPITPGAVLTVSSVLESVDLTDSGETFTVKATETLASGEVAAEVRGTMFIRGTAPRGRGPRDPLPTRRLPSGSCTRSQPRSTTIRWCATRTRQGIAIRYTWIQRLLAKRAPSPDPARDVHDGDGDEGRRQRSCRRRPHQRHTCRGALQPAGAAGARVDDTKLWPETEGEGPDRFGFATLNPDGKAVINNGQVEIR